MYRLPGRDGVKKNSSAPRQSRGLRQMIGRKVRLRPCPQTPLATGLLEAFEVAVILFGIGFRILEQRIGQRIAFADITADLRSVPGRFGVRTGEGAATDSTVGGKRFVVEGFQFGGDFHVAQLTHVKMATVGAGGPAEEQITGGLHQPLAIDHALTVMPHARLGLHVIGEHRPPCFLELQEQRELLLVSQQRHQAARADTADTDHFERQVLNTEARQQPAPVGLQGR